jgi:hypothetical protein
MQARERSHFDVFKLCFDGLFELLIARIGFRLVRINWRSLVDGYWVPLKFPVTGAFSI